LWLVFFVGGVKRGVNMTAGCRWKLVLFVCECLQRAWAPSSSAKVEESSGNRCIEFKPDLKPFLCLFSAPEVMPPQNVLQFYCFKHHLTPTVYRLLQLRQLTV
jgi:hypothetical protein